MPELRSIIRQLLVEELERIRQKQGSALTAINEETVSIKSSSDLNAFAMRLLGKPDHDQLLNRLRSGQYRFLLSTDMPSRAKAPKGPAAAEFQRGMVTERDIIALAAGIRTLRLGKSVCLTPLARDEIARRSISMERISI